MDWLWSVLIVSILLTFHELGHVLAARLFSLRLEQIGFSWTPLPHPFVAVLNVPDTVVKYAFLFAGPLMTLLLFGLCWQLELLAIPVVYWAFVFEFMIEYNPFRSDFTIAAGQETYPYSVGWYAHVTAWMGLFWLLTSPDALRNVFF